MRQLTQYAIHTGKLSSPKRIIVVSDLHDGSFEDILPMLQGADALLVPGDIVNRYRQGYARGVAFLQTAAERLPTYFGVGNHEMRLKHPSAFWNAVGQTATHCPQKTQVVSGRGLSKKVPICVSKPRPVKLMAWV